MLLVYAEKVIGRACRTELCIRLELIRKKTVRFIVVLTAEGLKKKLSFVGIVYYRKSLRTEIQYNIIFLSLNNTPLNKAGSLVVYREIFKCNIFTFLKTEGGNVSFENKIGTATVYGDITFLFDVYG